MSGKPSLTALRRSAAGMYAVYAAARGGGLAWADLPEPNQYGWLGVARRAAEYEVPSGPSAWVLGDDFAQSIWVRYTSPVLGQMTTCATTAAAVDLWGVYVARRGGMHASGVPFRHWRFLAVPEVSAWRCVAQLARLPLGSEPTPIIFDELRGKAEMAFEKWRSFLE